MSFSSSAIFGGWSGLLTRPGGALPPLSLIPLRTRYPLFSVSVLVRCIRHSYEIPPGAKARDAEEALFLVSPCTPQMRLAFVEWDLCRATRRGRRSTKIAGHLRTITLFLALALAAGSCAPPPCAAARVNPRFHKKIRATRQCVEVDAEAGMPSHSGGTPAWGPSFRAIEPHGARRT
ncbi:hypothetical protein DFH06DRAFT_1320579 [Mycena polygramma]|nr:hypothetical protein DFH06DRAFT_1320579 [Mycena polygramma]